MRILILGASGFIGRHVAGHLAEAGHRLVLAGRAPRALQSVLPDAEIVACNLATDRLEDWLPRLIGIDAVINAAGLFRGTSDNDIAAVHTAGPCRLFDACAALGVPRVIQISAQGADASATARFHVTKRAADDYLTALAKERGETGWIVLRPALVVGRGGGSTALFSAIAALPFPLRIGAGQWTVRPLHIADLVAAIGLVLASDRPLPQKLDLVGAQELTTDAFTDILRRWLALPPAPFIALPQGLWRIGAALGTLLPIGLLSRESLDMLERSYPGGPEAAAQALGWRARPLALALACTPATAADRAYARLAPLRLFSRLALGAVWLASGLVSAFGFPLAESVRMVEGLGIDKGPAAMAIVYAGAALDTSLGVLLLAGIRRAWLGYAQIAVMLLYTVLATIAVPALWLNPFGPLTKNIAVFLAILVWMILEDAS